MKVIEDRYFVLTFFFLNPYSFCFLVRNNHMIEKLIHTGDLSRS